MENNLGSLVYLKSDKVIELCNNKLLQIVELRKRDKEIAVDLALKDLNSSWFTRLNNFHPSHYTREEVTQMLAAESISDFYHETRFDRIDYSWYSDQESTAHKLKRAAALADGVYISIEDLENIT